MSFYYGIPDDSDEDDISSCSAEIEGGVVNPPRTPSHNNDGGTTHSIHNENGPVTSCNGSASNDNDRGDNSVGDNTNADEHANFIGASERDTKNNEGHASDQDETQYNTRKSSAQHYETINNTSNDSMDDQMATLIQNERNRRLGVVQEKNVTIDNNNNIQKSPINRSSSDVGYTNAAAGVGVLGNIRGWFGGGGGGGAVGNMSATERRSSAPVIQTQYKNAPPIPAESKFVKTQSYNNEDDDDNKSYSSSSSGESSSSSESDYSSSSNSSNASSSIPKYGDVDLTPQERARARALRYLSNSCVDAGRKAKTASYIRGLERLDLKRKRDRYEKELEIVEIEMNKDRGLSSDRDDNDNDAISNMAARLVRELPRIQGADAGAGSDVGKDYMSYDEYTENDTMNTDDDDDKYSSVWNNKEAVDLYVNSLQSRLKVAFENTRSLEKRLVVLEQTGDDIINSLCEDLVDVTGHSNKSEARYVKKGKELQRKRRREEVRSRSKIKQAERRVRKLEEKLMIVSGVRDLEKQLDMDPKSFFDGTDVSLDGSSSSEENDDDDNEVLLEQKLSTIKAKNERDKEQHISEVESIRRQCEQLKLRLSVARLVMEGDDNLREYIALLGRFSSNSSRFSGRTNGATIPSPPLHITKARAKLLKVTHLGRIYEQRLSISKAFTDATINALDQELVERETASQKMEVRCLNELVLIDSSIKDIVGETNDKLTELESEARELQEAVAACGAEKAITDIGDMFGGHSDPPKQSALPSETTIIEEKASDAQLEANSAFETDALAMDRCYKPWRNNDIADKSGPQTPPREEAIVIDNVSTGGGSKQEEEEEEKADLTSSEVQSKNEVADKSSLHDSDKEDSVASETFPPEKTTEIRDQPLSNKVDDNETYSLQPNVNNAQPIASTNSDTASSPDTHHKLLPQINSTDDELLTEKPSLADINLENSDDQKSKEDLTVDKTDLPDTKIDKQIFSDLSMDEKGDEKGENDGIRDQQKEIDLQELGREFQSTLAEYQTSFGVSSSIDRVGQLEHMNDLVLKIAKVGGLKCPNTDPLPKRDLLKSWSLKNSRHKSMEEKKERHEKKRSKKTKTKRRRKGNERREKSKDSRGKLHALDSDLEIQDRGQSLVW